MSEISIIIPIYNVEKYLRECLDSVINQTFSDIEIICINDCSPDNSAKILDEYAKNDNRLKVVTLEENGGLGNARNIGLKNVTSKYVMFLDSDDWLELNACELAYNQIVKNDNDFVIFNLYQYSEQKQRKELATFKIRPLLSKIGTDNFNINDITTPCLANCECWYKIYKTSFLLENAFLFENGTYEDQIFNCKLFACARSISIIDKPLYNYRIRKGSITSDVTNFQSYLNAKWKAFNFIDNIENSSIKQKLLRYWIITSIELSWITFQRHIKSNRIIAKEYYSLIRDFYIDIDKKYSLLEYKKDLHYKQVKMIVQNNSYYTYKIFELLLLKMFSINNFGKHIIISVLGLTIRLKK